MRHASESGLYKDMYLYLFTQVSAALEELERGRTAWAAEHLRMAQLHCEEVFVENADEE